MHVIPLTGLYNAVNEKIYIKIFKILFGQNMERGKI